MLSKITPLLITQPMKHKQHLYTTQSTTHIISSLFHQCTNTTHIHQTHAFMLTRALDQDNFHLSRFIEACSNTNLINHAISVFSHKSFKNTHLYNTMIKTLLTHSRVKDAIFVYKEAKLDGLSPDCYTFPVLLKGVVRAGDRGLIMGKMVHCEAICYGFRWNVYVRVELVRMYVNCGCVYGARKVFDEMFVRDVAVWNAMVSGYCKVGEVERARALFDVMPERNVVSWTALIAGYAQANRPSEAVDVFSRMEMDGVIPDEVTMVAVLSACAQLGALELGERIHEYINKHRLHKSVSLYNTLIDMYAKSGNINKAVEVFETMKDRCVITWTTVIAGLALHGLGKQALDMFTRMEKAHVKPNDVTLISVLSACSHGGLVESGRWYFNNLFQKYGIEPRIEHYGCMIDLLGRAGCLLEAQELLNRMPFEPNAAIWGSLLAASRLYGNVELGQLAVRHLVKLEPNNSRNFLLLSNMYASGGHWNESRLTRKVMRDSGVKKISGSSCVELNSRVHEFVSGDSSHPQSERIYEVLSMLSRQMEVININI
ncbi:putative tetratricopeptide-like helical domain superfamily [Helianthus annuus]|nr:putative tetratricopeptide-like helical domain superfamily [Helianthus annuus]KAJ0617052.1 putative tetratricopeptide-like helical domain superfamily [Helianthus annuus]KAJ0778564.1 putative tetratricopeptide-like helical domain superfamily [Helianthus annuus]KAJ0941530.1 putative tetratricopeptide-like helical domain superfamily [Helianthus annuus]KAJ0953221.1 putative tetratricopeptide-like helical domain superfamily [Helianthus annuus]